MSTKSLRKAWTRPTGTSLLMPAIGLLIVLLVIWFLRGAGQTQNPQVLPPVDFQLLAEIDLAARPYELEQVGQIVLEETAVVDIFYTLPNVDTAYFDLSLLGVDGHSYVILHSEDYRTDEQGGGKWEQSLPAGVYQVVLTAKQSPGILSVYWGTH